MANKAVVLLSGGIDSTTVLYMALDRGYECACLIFDYNQRHKKEILKAQLIAERSACSYKIVKIDFPWKASALLDHKAKIPVDRGFDIIDKEIPSTYVPARNTIFLSIALGLAESMGADRIFIGANAVDYSGYPDCRPGYFNTFNRLIKEGTKAGAEGRDIAIETPLIDMTKGDIIKTGLRLNVPYDLTWSCYQGKDLPCMKCDSCILRLKGFEEAGERDPATVNYR